MSLRLGDFVYLGENRRTKWEIVAIKEDKYGIVAHVPHLFGFLDRYPHFYYRFALTKIIPFDPNTIIKDIL